MVASPRAVLVSLLAMLLAGCAPSGGAAAAMPTLAGSGGAPVLDATPTPSAPAPSHQVVGPAGVGTPVAGAPPVTGHPWFLTVGDSITAGYTRDVSRAGTNAAWPVQLQRLLATRGQAWQLFDTACSSETTTTYASGCHSGGDYPFLAGTTQQAVAVRATHDHAADLRLIVVDLGSNDLQHADLAKQSQQQVIDGLIGRLATIVEELHNAAPAVPIVVTTLYDPFALSAPWTVAPLRSTNDGLRAMAAREGARVADFFTAVNGADGTDPSLCQWVDCAHFDIHLTVAGHARLAAAALAAVRA